MILSLVKIIFIQQPLKILYSYSNLPNLNESFFLCMDNFCIALYILFAKTTWTLTQFDNIIFCIALNNSLSSNTGTFSVVSGDDVSIQAANTNNPNVPASEVLISAGSGTNKIGGSGGDVIMLAGTAAGGEFVLHLNIIC